MFITVTLIDKEPYDCFIFHNTYTTYNGKKSVECISSFKETDDSVFVLGFLCSNLYSKQYINSPNTLDKLALFISSRIT